jgi:hypothetical protein
MLDEQISAELLGTAFNVHIEAELVNGGDPDGVRKDGERMVQVVRLDYGIDEPILLRSNRSFLSAVPPEGSRENFLEATSLWRIFADRIE